MDTLDRLGNHQYTIMVCLLYLRAYIRTNLVFLEQRPGFYHPWSAQGARQFCTEAEGAYGSHADAITCHDLSPSFSNATTISNTMMRTPSSTNWKNFIPT